MILDSNRICEDCEEYIPVGQRRHRCPECGKLVCHWCWHHVHQLQAVIAAGLAKLRVTPK